MRFNEFNEGIDPGAKAAIKGMRQLSGDQYYGLYKTMKDVAGHDGKKQTAPEGKTDHEVSDKPFAYAYSDAEKNMIKGVDPKAKQITSDKSEELDEGVAEGWKGAVAGGIAGGMLGGPIGAVIGGAGGYVLGGGNPNADLPDDPESAYELGQQAARDGKTEEDNPYEEGWRGPSDEMQSWHDGWESVQQGVAEGRYDNRDAYQRDYDSSQTGFGRGERDSERHDIDTNNEYRAEHGTWYVRIDGIVDPTPYQGKAAANAAGLELKKQPGNENKLFMLTTKA